MDVMFSKEAPRNAEKDRRDGLRSQLQQLRIFERMEAFLRHMDYEDAQQAAAYGKLHGYKKDISLVLNSSTQTATTIQRAHEAVLEMDRLMQVFGVEHEPAPKPQERPATARRRSREGASPRLEAAQAEFAAAGNEHLFRTKEYFAFIKMFKAYDPQTRRLLTDAQNDLLLVSSADVKETMARYVEKFIELRKAEYPGLPNAAFSVEADKFADTLQKAFNEEMRAKFQEFQAEDAARGRAA